MTTETENRTVVGGLPWVEMPIHDDKPFERHQETWKVDIEGIHVWVKDYGESVSDTFCGWRVGRGGSPLTSLNDGVPFEGREEAMQAAFGVARLVAIEKLRDASQQVDDARRALEEVILPV